MSVLSLVQEVEKKADVEIFEVTVGSFPTCGNVREHIRVYACMLSFCC